MPRVEMVSRFMALISLGALIGFLNVFVATRDVPMTVGVETYEIGVEDLMFTPSRFWVESPMQTLESFLGSAVFLNVGNPESGEFDFVDRLALVYGEESLTRDAIVDLRTVLTPEDLEAFREQMIIYGYSSQRVCPHDQGSFVSFM